MKKFIAIFIALISVSAVFAKAKPRSLKANAEKIYSTKTAAKIAENYGLKQVKPEIEIQSKQFENKEFYVATGENNECIIYMEGKNKDLQSSFRNITFSYCNLNDDATSRISYVTDDGTLFLLNSAKIGEFDSGTHYMTAETYEEITKIIAKERANLKVWFMKNMGIKFKDKINEEQKQLTKIPM